MKILFIWPNYDCPIGMSIGVAYLSSVLQQEGFETKILHINDELGYPYDKDVIVKDIEEINPDIVCISTGENHYSDMYDLSKNIKEKLGKNIIIGGIHATLNAKDVLTLDSPFDYLIRGEGEWAISGKNTIVDKLYNYYGITKKCLLKNSNGKYGLYDFNKFMLITCHHPAILGNWIKNLAPDSVWPSLGYLRNINYLPTIDPKYSQEYIDLVKKHVDDLLINLESNDRLRK